MTELLSLKDRVAIVTGGAQGIGYAIVEMLALCGASIMIADVMTDKAEATAKEVADKTGQKVLARSVNVTESASAKAMVDAAVEQFGKVDILVNNAGITRDNLIMRLSEEDWDAVLDINLKGAFNCSQAVVRPMMKQRYGRIVNISSVSGVVGQAGQTNYSSSKAGLLGFTKALAKEVGSRNITVNAVAPGFIETRLTVNLPKEIKDISMKLTPMGRFGTPKDIAYAVAFLASEEASFITGATLQVDGGMAMT
ncbi:MAG: 3-oxoacyl-[acyl-carrier-protein] reductase [Anaerolineales bacterium]|nr:3-oxoacyl-[acyl-carrier-protein] reductase [Anaerolineales bacterium]